MIYCVNFPFIDVFPSCFYSFINLHLICGFTIATVDGPANSESPVDRKGGNLEIGETQKSSNCPYFSGTTCPYFQLVGGKLNIPRFIGFQPSKGYCTPGEAGGIRRSATIGVENFISARSRALGRPIWGNLTHHEILI